MDAIISIDSAPHLVINQLHYLQQKDPSSHRSRLLYLIDLAITCSKVNLIFNLCLELSKIREDTDWLEEYIVKNSKYPYFMYKMATELRAPNIPRLEQKLIDIGDMSFLARFALEVPAADKPRLEKILAESRSVSAIHTYIKGNKNCDVEPFREVLLSSRRPKCLYNLALRTKCPVELKKIEDILLSSDSMGYIRLYAAHVPGANLSRCEDRVLESGDRDVLKNYIRYVESDKISKVLLLW